MQYNRRFEFSSSHYGYWQHEIVWKAKVNGSISFDELMHLMSMLHGHNWVVDVEFSYEESEKVYGVWDQDIEKIVMEWKNCNISTHPDFFQEEWVSSSENTAQKLADKLLVSFPATIPSVKVVMYETKDIWVTAVAKR